MEGNSDNSSCSSDDEVDTTSIIKKAKTNKVVTLRSSNIPPLSDLCLWQLVKHKASGLEDYLAAASSLERKYQFYKTVDLSNNAELESTFLSVFAIADQGDIRDVFSFLNAHYSTEKSGLTPAAVRRLIIVGCMNDQFEFVMAMYNEMRWPTYENHLPAFITAAIQGHSLKLVQYWVQQQPGEFSSKHLFAAMLSGDIPIIEYLLECRCPNLSSEEKFDFVTQCLCSSSPTVVIDLETPREGNLDNLLLMESKYPDMGLVDSLRKKSEKLQTHLLIQAVRNGYLNVVSWMIKEMPHLSNGDNSMKILKEALCYRHLHILRYAVEVLGVRYNDTHKLSQRFKGLPEDNDLIMYLFNSPYITRDTEKMALLSADGRWLLSAITCGNVHIIDYLSPWLVLNVWDDNGEPLIIASSWGKLEVVKVLVEKCNAPSCEEALTAACEAGHLDVVEYLVERGVSIVEDCLCSANYHNHQEVVNYLLTKGACPEILEPHDCYHYAHKNWVANWVPRPPSHRGRGCCG